MCENETLNIIPLYRLTPCKFYSASDNCKPEEQYFQYHDKDDNHFTLHDKLKLCERQHIYIMHTHIATKCTKSQSQANPEGEQQPLLFLEG